MSSNEDFEKRIAKQMQAQANAAGIDPSKIDPDSVHVNTAGPTVNFEYAGARVTLPAPSQSALDQWFAENGKVIAGSLLTLAAVVVGAAISKR